MISRIYRYLLRQVHMWRLGRLSARGVTLGKGVQLYGFPNVVVSPGSRIVVGAGVVLCSSSAHTALSLNHPIKLSTLRPTACLSIGAGTGISGGTFIAAERISIGADVLIGANVTIIDTDFHPIASTNRRHSDDVSKIGVAPMDIGDNVFIGAGSIILKGTQIGPNSVVGAGSVVHGSFPADVVLAGNPAKIVGVVPA